MRLISRLEQASWLDRLVRAGRRRARLIKPGAVRDFLRGMWLGQPVHPVLVQVPAGAWLSASILDAVGDDERCSRHLVGAGLVVAVPAMLAGVADWSEQHERQLRVGVVHATGNLLAITAYGASLFARGPRAGRLLRLAGLSAVSVSGILGRHISARLSGGSEDAAEVSHLIQPGWQYLMPAADIEEGKPTRRMLGEVPVLAVRIDGRVYALADECSHLAGPLSEGKLADGHISCPWHGSLFRVADGAVTRGPATADQPVFEVRESAGAIEVRLPSAELVAAMASCAPE